jgi:hypothetical protein
MSQPTRLPVTPIPPPQRFVVLGGVMGALQPVLISLIARWFLADARWGTTVSDHLRLIVTHVLVCTVLGALVAWCARWTWVRLGRESLLITLPTYGFLSTAILIFLYLTPQ